MASEPPAPDDSTQLSAAGTVSPADSLHQFPTDQASPPPTDSDSMLAKFGSIARDEITMASRKLSSDLVKGSKEIGHPTNQLEQHIDLATTVLEGYEEEVDKLSAKLEITKDKLEDVENRVRRDNLRIRGVPEAITDLHGTATAFFPGTGS